MERASPTCHGRLAAGRIDRGRPLRFTFDGQRYQGYPGDTLASALLANGVHVVGAQLEVPPAARHRDRGRSRSRTRSCSSRTGAAPMPNSRATEVELYEGLVAESVNAGRSLRFDVGGGQRSAVAAIMPGRLLLQDLHVAAQRLWPQYEHVIRHAAGLGKAPEAPDPDRYDKTYAHCDVLVVGAGPAGLAAALAAGAAGARVILVDEQAELGGSLLASGEPVDGKPGDGKPASEWLADAVAELGAHAGGDAAPAHHGLRLLRPQLPHA